MEWRDSAGAPQVFNLGNNRPVELMRFVKVCLCRVVLERAMPCRPNLTRPDFNLAKKVLEATLGKEATIHEAGGCFHLWCPLLKAGQFAQLRLTFSHVQAAAWQVTAGTENNSLSFTSFDIHACALMFTLRDILIILSCL